jgi:HD-like signal output (HDOD) protein
MSAIFAPAPARLLKPLPNPVSWAAALAGAEIPVLRPTAAALAAFAEHEETANAHDIAEIVMGDPLMTARLFTHLAERAGKGRTSSLGSVTRAVVMLGVHPFFRAFSSLAHVGEHLRDDHASQRGLLRVVARAVRAAQYARDWAVIRQDREAETIMMAALLHDLAEMLVWCAAPAMALEIRKRLDVKPGLRSREAQLAVLQCTYEEIQAELMTRLRLPELLVAMNDPREARDLRVRTVSLAIRLARHSAAGWDDPALPDDYTAIAELLHVSPQRVREMVVPPPAHVA